MARFKSAGWKWLFIAALTAMAIALGLFASPRPKANLSDVHSVEDLRARFNQDKGKPRIILLLSPT